MPATLSQITAAAPTRTAGGLQVDMVWSGVGTGIGAATARDGTHLFAYYDADRYLTLAAIDPAGRITRRRLASRFAGWDAHNAITMAIGPDDSLHIAGNMHASPMVYAHGPHAPDIASVRLSPMTGQNEASATYPHFLHDAKGNLLFMYRDGGSGNGTWLLNRWEGGAWTRVGSLFADHDDAGPISAYPTEFVRGPDGRFHVAVVWRRTPDVATNFALSYASTADFRSWQAGGRSITGPLSPETMATVDAPGENAGLVNNAALGLDGAGRPIILYTRYGEGGHNAIFAATPGANGWTTRAIATAPGRAQIAGRGSIPDLPVAVFAGPPRGSRLPVHIALPHGGDLHDRVLDTDRLALIAADAPHPHADDPVADALKAQTNGMADVALHDMPVPAATPGEVAGRLRWFAQKANGDRPRACTDDAPRACAPPPSPLLWFPDH